MLQVSTHDLTKRSTIAHQGCVAVANVSTHDLTKRSTPGFRMAYLCTDVSTHDLTKRSTGIPPAVLLLFCVSTHDLTKRSTSIASLPSNRNLCFNSRPHEEVDCFALPTVSTVVPFQLTTSRRGRQQFLRKKFSFQNHFLCSLHIIYSYYINTIFFSTLFLAKSSFFLVRIL